MSNAPTFEAIATAHIDAAYNLARWLTRDRVLADDVVQESMLRGLTYFRGFRGENPRAWLLQIVRNVALSKLDSRGLKSISIDEPSSSVSASIAQTIPDVADGPETTLERQQEREFLAGFLNKLPIELRECLVLREIEECSYKEIARIIDAPIGTVMSRLWRGRQLLIEMAEREEQTR